MTSGEYLKQLEKYLRKLPQSDYEDAMEYFTEYFADAGPEKEQEIIAQVAKGYSNKEIAAALCFSEGTIRNYLSSILEKLQLRDRTQLAVYYYHHQMDV